VDDVPVLWEELGEIVGREVDGRRFAGDLRAAIEQARLERDRRVRPGPRFLYYVWKDPWMVAGRDTYISSLLEATGFRNAMPEKRDRYPKLTEEERAELTVDVHMFATEPYRFELPRDSIGLGEGAQAILVDGEILSWFPSLSREGIAYARDLLLRSEATG
jgi:hypothetical protein